MPRQGYAYVAVSDAGEAAVVSNGNALSFPVLVVRGRLGA
jgi:hypothetical protein